MEKPHGFQDDRLQARLDRVTRLVEKAPTVSFPQMCGGSELEALYRFFGNPKVTPDGILFRHFEEVARKASQARAVLVLHDTTRFDFAHRKGSRPTKFFAHFSLALGSEGYRQPLGVANIKTWRQGELEDKQARWYEGLCLSAERLGRRDAIHVMDRESDDFALFSQMISEGHRFVSRLMHRGRGIIAKDQVLKLEDAVTLFDCVVERMTKLTERIDTYRTDMERQIHPSRDSRQTTLAIGARTLEFKRPKPHHKDSARRRAIDLPPSLKLNVVRVWEPEPPEGEAGVEWILATSEPIDTPEQIGLVVDHYRTRWTIEEYFKALKTGCAYERRQIGDYEGLCNVLATFAPIACRALALRAQSREAPENEQGQVLAEDEIEVLRKAGRRPLPDNPTNRDLLLSVAALGGYLQRHDDPGWLTISRGLQLLESLVAGWRLAKLQ